MNEIKTIRVQPNSELARALDAAGEIDVVLEKDGVRYRVTRIGETGPVADLWEHYDPKQSLAQLRSTAGGWRGLVDADALKEYVAERRRTANRPSVRL